MDRKLGSRAAASYWRDSRAPRYSLLFALPLLLLYELLAYTLTRAELSQVRNGADVMLKSVFTALGGRYGLTGFTALLAITGLILIWRDRRAHGPIRPALFPGMLLEAVGYAALLGGVASGLTSLLLHGQLAILPQSGFQGLGLPSQLMVSLGAGIYEELVFRVLLVSGLALLARKGLGLGTVGGGILAAVVGALLFSLFHYVGPLGDRFTLSSFTFRAIAGLLFSGLYLLRGFGITAWAHALYDVFLAVLA
jgi:hypothetical protein